MPAKHTVRLPLRAFLLLVPQPVAQSQGSAPTCPPVRDSLYAESLSSGGVTVQGTALALGAKRETSESNQLFDRCYQISKFNTKRKLEPSLLPRARVLAQTDASCNEEKTCPTLIPLTYKSPPPAAYVYPTYLEAQRGRGLGARRLHARFNSRRHP